MNVRQNIIGCLLGTAVGDALGLPSEGLSRTRQRRLFPDTGRYHLLFGHGMVSDDTEQTLMVAQALIVSGGDATAFCHSLSRLFRLWLLGLPAGIGLATLRAILKLWLGFGPARSGVFSAGNGPAMRSSVLGVCYPNDSEKRQALVRLSTRLTHTDPKAEWGAQTVALAAAMASGETQVMPQEFFTVLKHELGAEAVEFLDLIQRAVLSAEAGEASDRFADSIGLSRGVGGYVYHTVPVVVQTWLRHQDDWRGGVEEVIRCGGDTDTTAAIVGSLIGTRVGKEGIPPSLLAGLCEWPHTVSWMEYVGSQLAEAVATNQPGQLMRAWGGYARNLLFLCVVLVHGFRRLLPPF